MFSQELDEKADDEKATCYLNTKIRFKKKTFFFFFFNVLHYSSLAQLPDKHWKFQEVSAPTCSG